MYHYFINHKKAFDFNFKMLLKFRIVKMWKKNKNHKILFNCGKIHITKFAIFIILKCTVSTLTMFGNQNSSSSKTKDTF